MIIIIIITDENYSSLMLSIYIIAKICQVANSIIFLTSAYLLLQSAIVEMIQVAAGGVRACDYNVFDSNRLMTE